MADVHRGTERHVLTGIRFSKTSGQNVHVLKHGTSAQWKLAIHTGSFVTNRSVQKGQTLKVKLAGSGHVLVGLLPKKPNLGMALDNPATDLEPDGHWTHFRFRKQSMFLTLCRVKKKTVKFSTESTEKSEEAYICISDSDLYICFEIQFGDIQIDIEDIDAMKKPLNFVNARGGNILFENNQHRASLKDPNLSAICCTDRSLAEGEVININISPVDGAKWTHIDLFLSNKSADELQLHHLASGFGELVPSGGIRVEKRGPIQLRLSDRPQELVYTVRTQEIRVDVRGLDWQKPIYLCLRLFRNEVTIGSTLPEKEEPPYVTILAEPGHPEATAKNSGCVDSGSFKGGFPELPDASVRNKEGKVQQYKPAEGGYLTEIPEHGNSEITRASFHNKEGQIQPQLKSSDCGYITPFMQPGSKLANDGYLTTILAEKNKAKLTDSSINDKKLEGNSNTTDDGYITPTNEKRNIQEDVLRNIVQNVSELLQPNPDKVPPRVASGEASGPTAPRLPPRRVSEECFGIDHSYINQQNSVEEFAGQIRKHYVELRERLEPDPISDYFFQEHIISKTEHSSVLEMDKQKKVVFILEIAHKRPTSKHTFFKALMNSSQDDLKKLLEK